MNCGKNYSFEFNIAFFFTDMSEFEETWTEQDFYEQSLDIWDDHEDIQWFDIFTAASLGDLTCIKNMKK